jgi:hypothetical protein
MRFLAVAAAAALAARTLCAASVADSSVLTQRGVLELTLSAPFADLFAHVDDSGRHVTGRLAWRDADTGREETLDGLSIAIRGHTSKQASECTFPKLKIDLPKGDRADTPFAGLHAIKIGTHCGDRPDGELTPKYGRLANEHAALREALVYSILHAVHVPTLLARPARITYVFTDDPGRQPVTRDAMLLEDDDEAKARFEATASIDEGAFGSAREQFDPHDTATLAFAEAMIGNFDWCLRMFPGDIYRCDDRHPLWNVLAFARADGRTVPLIYDFDLSGPVVGRHVWFNQVFDADYVDPASSVDVEVQAQVQRTRSLFDRALLDDTRARFVAARPQIEAAIDNSPADAHGKDHAHAYITAFFRNIESDEAFYRPVVVEGEHIAALDFEGKRPVCGESSTVPAGTPVSAPLETREGRVRVRLLDALWQWTGPQRCDAVHTQAVWIDAAAIGTNYPR